MPNPGAVGDVGAIVAPSQARPHHCPTVLIVHGFLRQAESELRKLCLQLLAKFDDVKRVAVAHRVGVVPVGEESVIIVVSSAHRKAAFAGAEFMIDELKACCHAAPLANCCSLDE